MAKQTFTTGQVLTAAQMTSLQQTAMGGGSATAKTASYVLVAADAGTTVAMNAAGATTITVNTGLFAAGDTVFIQNLGAGACTVTAGTATVATAGSLILPQNDAGILYFTATGASIFYDYIQAGAVSPLTTKGDVYTFSTSDARLAVGTNGQVLTADSSEATGLKFAAPSAASFAGVRLTKSIGQTISNNTDTMVTWDVETFDVGGYHDNSSNTSRITIPSGEAGYYQINVTLDYAANGTGQRVITLAKNGTNRAYNLNIIRAVNAGGYTSVFYSDIVYGAVADYFEISTFQDSGGNVNIIGNNGDPGACYVSFSLIGA
jgi:hypothetical protein